ncbi:MAG: hypothetical protein AYK22_01910 [Thermoplasmatales archaeon SG8-52-3]|nr:MAG: hypothetical protein AYK22_01910 [Thermoplasmatales archaeon SG8-52-3]
MNIIFGKKITRKLISLLTVYCLLSILIISAITVSACHHTVGTFEEDFETSKDSFFKGEIIYGLGQAFGYNYLLKLRIRDPDGNVVYYSNESKYIVNCSFLLNDSAKIGTWNIQLGIFKCGWQWTISSDRISYFTVSNANFTLTININGNGSVIKDPDKTFYSYGQVVNVSAVADLGWNFNNWTGDIESSINPESVLMDSNKLVNTNFVQDKYILTINITGNGSVLISPNLSYYLFGSVVNFTAQPDEGWNFDSWEGNLSGNENPISILIDDNKNITAVFSEQETLFTLHINIDGNGVVDIDNYGPYHFGDIVNLTAIASEGSKFDHWSEDLSGNNNPASINITENKNVTAHFKIVKEENGGGGNGGGGVIPTSTKISNKPPIADLSGGEPYIGFINEDIEFNASLSYDSDGHIAEWFWNFGDGTTALGETVKHNYSTPGDYSVILIVTDDNGASDTDLSTAVITKPNHPPSKPNVSGPTEGLVDIEYEFSIFSIDEDDDEIKYTVDWGDGKINESIYLKSGEPFNVIHKWTTPGNYKINISADDNDTVVTIDITIILDEEDIPEQNNILIIIIMIIGLLLVLLFLILSKPKKEKKEEKTNKK